MSWMANRRAAYHPDGPFVAKRGEHVGNIKLVFGGIYTAKQLREEANISQQLIQRLYDTHWMDMAPEGAETGPLPVPPVEPEEDHLATLFGSDALPSMVEIAPDHSVPLGDVVRHAFDASDLTVKQWNALPPAEREPKLSAAVEAMKIDYAESHPAKTPEDEVAVGFVSLGFGRYQRVNAAGGKFGPFEKKAIYEQSQLPLVQAE